MLAIPYSLISDKYGRSFALTLGLIGLVCEKSWSFIVAWFSEDVPIRLILLAPAFEIIGGGSAVITTMLHVLATSVASAETRTNTFFILRATGIFAAVAAQVSSSSLMDRDLWLPWFIGLASLLLSAATACIIPDSVNPVLSEIPLLADGPTTTNQALPIVGSLDESEMTVKVRLSAAVNSLKAGLGIVLANSQLMLILSIAFFCQLSEDSVPMMLLM